MIDLTPLSTIQSRRMLMIWRKFRPSRVRLAIMTILPKNKVINLRRNRLTNIITPQLRKMWTMTPNCLFQVATVSTLAETSTTVLWSKRTFFKTFDGPTLSAALLSDEKSRWLTAIREEFDTLKANCTRLKSSKTLESTSVLPSGVVLKVKRDTSGAPVKYKTRQWSDCQTQKVFIRFTTSTYDLVWAHQHWAQQAGFSSVIV